MVTTCLKMMLLLQWTWMKMSRSWNTRDLRLRTKRPLIFHLTQSHRQQGLLLRVHWIPDQYQTTHFQLWAPSRQHQTGPFPPRLVDSLLERLLELCNPLSADSRVDRHYHHLPRRVVHRPHFCLHTQDRSRYLRNYRLSAVLRKATRHPTRHHRHLGKL